MAPIGKRESKSTLEAVDSRSHNGYNQFECRKCRQQQQPLWIRMPGGDVLTTQKWPEWWDWELDLSPHLFKRMDDRRFTEIDLRAMLESATVLRPDAAEGRWIAETQFRDGNWEIVVEPDQRAHVLVVITAYARG